MKGKRRKKGENSQRSAQKEHIGKLEDLSEYDVLMGKIR